MNTIIMNIETDMVPKRVPAMVPLAYFALYDLQKMVDKANNIMMRTEKVNCENVDHGIPLWKRYSLSVPEAARYFGIGETRLYRIIAEHSGADFILEIGSHVKIKRVLFERYLDAASCV